MGGWNNGSVPNEGPSVEALRTAPVYFRYGRRSVLIDAFTAYAMLAVYDGLTQPESQAKFVQMLTTNPAMMKLADFCFSQVRAK